MQNYKEIHTWEHTCSSNILVERIKKYPLNRELLAEFGTRNKVFITHKDITPTYGLCHRYDNDFHITINREISRREREITLVHELCHAVYKDRLMWMRSNKDNLEVIIEETGVRLYSENNVFFKELYKKIAPIEWKQEEFIFN
ncbi:hypothetical protein HYU23_02055 [Candidatus Woesearchaeota archaeon]|nr:hypothetical protein [Candidatus Woesearchaeota archaeon]